MRFPLWTFKGCTSKPPFSFGGLLFTGFEKISRFGAFLSVLALLGFSAYANAALRIQSPPAVLQWINTFSMAAQAQADVEVIRYERIGFYYYDPKSEENFDVWSGNFADQDSLSGTPNLLGSLPVPLDDNGNPLPLNGSLPLSDALDHEFTPDEALFVVAEGPILPPSAFNIRIDGLRFIAVTLDVDNGDSFIITLVETSPGSGDFVGYLQPNLPNSPIVIPPGSSITIRYDDYGDVPDSETINAPWFVDPSVLADIELRRTSVTTNAPVTEPEYEMLLTKQALRNSAVTGDFLAYELRLENTGTVLLPNLEIIDTLPRGFRYQNKSTKINGQAEADPLIDPTGQQLTFAMNNLSVGESVILRYVVEVTVAAETGEAINYAQAHSGSERSNRANAVVLVEQPFFNDRAFLLGRVLVGTCGDENAQGLEGVRLYLEDGSNVVTDKQGRWHIEGIMPGTHVLQLDTLTLGPRYKLQQCHDNTRQAANPASRFVNVQGGTLWREDWYLTKAWSTDANIEQHLSSKLLPEKGTVELELPVRMGERKYEQVFTKFFIPDDLKVVPGSATLNGFPIKDLIERDGVHELVTQPEGYFAKYTLGLSLAVDPDVKQDKEVLVKVESLGVTSEGEIYSVVSTNLFAIKSMLSSDNVIQLHPQFSSMSAELSAVDKANIEKGISALRDRPNLYLHVVGHSDSQPIRYRAGRAINDNYALSEVRAKAVAEYVAQFLAIDMERVTIEGRGSDEPIADNTSAAGRAKNRRVAIQFRFTEKTSDASLEVLEGYSGINNDKNVTAVTTQQEKQEEKYVEQQGFVNLQDGWTFTQPVFSATALLDSKLKARLLLNDQEVPDGRIGMKMVDENSSATRYTWVGLELDKIGDHRIELQGIDAFGNTRFSEVLGLRRSGNIKTIRLLDASANIADGRTPVKIKVELLDDFDKPVTNGVQLVLVSGTLQPLNTSQNDNPLETRHNIVDVDTNGFIRFEPVGTAGTYRIKLSAGDSVSDYMEIPITPDLREWILVGFAEGTLGYNTLEGNMSALSAEEEHLYSDGDSAFFARGKVKGEWLLTVAYDNRRQEDDNPLMQRIDPQQWYVLYGDDTIRGHDAPSREQLYLRIEKTDFYALFGDYDTGFNVTELARYQRTLTGAKAEWIGRNVSASGFAAQTNQGFIRDDIAGDGTSGLYRLSRQNIVFGSEEIVIETRDRFTNEVLSTEPMTRFVDYNLDYIDGSLYFRRPIFVQDENFNPQRIVVRYEVDSGEVEMVGGGRVTVYDAEKKLVVGVTGVDDNTTGANGTLGGLDATWKPNEAHTVKAEVAGTHQDSITSSNDSEAGLVEYTYTSAEFDSRVRVEETDGGFGLGQLASDDGDIRTALADGRYRFTEAVSLSGTASRQELLSNENQREVLETRLEYVQPEWKAYSGLRNSEDAVNDELYQSQKFIAGGQRQLMDQRLSLSVTGETDIDSSENVDYPNLLSLGSDYRLTSKASVFANQDFSWSDERRSQDTRMGVRANPWTGATATSDVSRYQDEYGPRLLAHAGLFQTVTLTSQWSADFGLDRSQTLRDNNSVIVDEVFDPRRALAQGTLNDDYTAVSAGTGYRTAQWQWTNRVELRRADTDDKWSLMSGFQHRLDETDTVAGRVLHFDQRVFSGTDLRSSEIDFSYSRRPLSNSWYWLNRSQLIADEMVDSSGEQEGNRIVNNTHVNFIHEYRHQLSVQYGARYVRDTIDEMRYTGYSDLIGSEYRYDITERWDLGFRVSTLASYNSDIRMNSYGVMAGYSPIKDVWISLGYNFKGFYDQDFSDAETRVEGIVLNFRIKLDQDGAKTMLEGEPQL